MRVVVKSIGKVGSRVRVGSHEIVFVQATTVPGGEDRGPSPLDVMSVSVAAYLRGRGLSPEGLSVEMVAEKERVPVARIGRLTMKVRLPLGLGTFLICIHARWRGVTRPSPISRVVGPFCSSFAAAAGVPS